MSALPSLSNVNFDSDGTRAWKLLLRAEDAALAERPSHAKYQDHLVAVRVLGWFMKDFWDHPPHRFGTTPYLCLVSKILSCYTVEKLFALGLIYRNHLICVFRNATGLTSSYVSPPSFDEYKEQVLVAMANGPQTKADVKALALHRDGYRCMITGAYDILLAVQFLEILEQPAKKSHTQCACLFPASAQTVGKEDAATAFTMLELFGLRDEVHKLLGGQVDSLRNALTMTGDMHTSFDQFIFWLEEVEGELDTYDVVSIVDDFCQATDARSRVTFKVDPAVVKDCESKGISLPDLPDPDLIAIRASCARVARISGAVEQNDEIIEDREMIPVLASDGSNADLLKSLLNRRVIT
ncbi:hypothetical protein AGABI1DRAFT_131574 [Agaricus bisporus var. burnettii JB137-S8]|uniref:HNH nuclease domain-containing protein n=1 Tax=Agaricus bisporus var. burnettii (strain JB137-S8 / ATCC MYA-4627 / FGSC 10392) TaxID=597362 RepID=K5VNL5_AGABU|nr:uncharacterized protein AGABI1DRAFT_131574 [Agaricus bisporus var. burnettii JB137-S8]EKM76054.1 hypothetical protein AGABI1DRAFT_131574 [Agaricus bisporus var. burnettii JB137-S8]